MFISNNQAWSDSTNVSRTGGDSRTPTIVVSPDGNVHIFFSDNSLGEYELRYAKNGTSEPTFTNTRGSFPSVVSDKANNLYLVWYDSLSSLFS